MLDWVSANLRLGVALDQFLFVWNGKWFCVSKLGFSQISKKLHEIAHVGFLTETCFLTKKDVKHCQVFCLIVQLLRCMKPKCVESWLWENGFFDPKNCHFGTFLWLSIHISYLCELKGCQGKLLLPPIDWTMNFSVQLQSMSKKMFHQKIVSNIRRNLFVYLQYKDKMWRFNMSDL